MNKSNFWGLLFMALCMVYTSGYSQEEELTKEICDQKADFILQAEQYLPHIPRADIDAMINYITPCADLDYSRVSPKSAYAKALLHLQKGDVFYPYPNSNPQDASSFYFNRSAYYKYPPGMLARGINELSNVYRIKKTPKYQDVAEDFEELLTQGFESDIVHYILGYLSLKNLATREDFTSGTQANKAKMHFESSNHPMAKHWLAIMHYFGYGVPLDRAKGLQMLSASDIYNSRNLLQNLQNQNNNWIPISAEERLATVENFNMLDPATTLIGDRNIKTTFNGYFLEFDWLVKGVKRLIPITFSITRTNELYNKDEFVYELIMNEKISSGTGWISNTNSDFETISFAVFSNNYKELDLPVKNLMRDHNDLDSLTYSIKSMQLKQAVIDGKSALVARTTWQSGLLITDFHEQLRSPFSMILYPEVPTSLTEQNLMINNTQSTGSEIDKNFATIAPNPISDQFTITYTLDQEAEVQVGIYDFFGQQRIQVPTQKSTAEATQTITVNSSGLSSGTYIIQMTVNGAHYSKMVIKE
ncbi:T9SS type A sorting domain-containing protein [Aquimarina celericrescens]|uniref:T9SS type A sorting domain-containing protein n=1 Tax=Aquimarina celericrescens TaxID=1964542 RepID=A0ABW5AYF9_9FLAO|nr:T9SS type A sorting domain-containing protein [Aquimarina celericrescens]